MERTSTYMQTCLLPLRRYKLLCQPQRLLAGAINEMRHRQDKTGESTDHGAPRDPPRTILLAAPIGEEEREHDLRNLVPAQHNARCVARDFESLLQCRQCDNKIHVGHGLRESEEAVDHQKALGCGKALQPGRVPESGPTQRTILDHCNHN